MEPAEARFSGVLAVLVTPFTADGRVDEASLTSLVEFYLHSGVQGLIALCPLGESRLLLDWERLRVIKRVVATVGSRVPVIVGALGTGSEVVAAFGRQARDLGASALMIAPPTIAWVSEERTVVHLGAVARAVGLPLVLLSYPPLGWSVSPSMLRRAIAAVPEIAAVRSEGTPALATTTALRVAAGQRLALLGGHGGIHCVAELERGVEALVAGTAYPEGLIDVFERARGYAIRGLDAGTADDAHAAHARWLPLWIHEADPQVGVAVTKELLRMRGVIRCSAVRAPTPAIDGLTRAQLNRLARRVVGGVDLDRESLLMAS